MKQGINVLWCLLMLNVVSVYAMDDDAETELISFENPRDRAIEVAGDRVQQKLFEQQNGKPTDYNTFDNVDLGGKSETRVIDCTETLEEREQRRLEELIIRSPKNSSCWEAFTHVFCLCCCIKKKK